MPDLPNTDSLASQLFELASTLHGAGLLDDAEEQYRMLLRYDPQHAAALHYLGLLMHQTGRDEEALRLVEHAGALLPYQADWRNDKGNMHFARQRYGQAAAAYEAALALRPRDVQIWTNLGATLRAQNKDDNAVEAFRQALEIAPEYAPAMLQLAEIYKQRGDRMLSSRYECMAYVLPPHEGKSRELLSLSLYFLGRIEDAARVCHAWLQEEPGHPKARHMHAAYAGLNPSTAAPLYVQAHFDEYAATFDQNLIQHLQYRGPQILGELLHVLLGSAHPALEVLDAGCGTGLCAPILAPHARSLEGVDLSAGMLEQADRRGLYTHLAKCDAGDWMRRHAQRYDLVCVCDVLIYVGELSGFLACAQCTLRAGGYLFFTVELADESCAEAFFLHPSGRFRHTRRYVEAALQAADLALLVMHEESLRLECGAPVPGLVGIAMA